MESSEKSRSMGAEREDDDEHRRDDAAAVQPDEQLGALPLLGCREARLDPLQEHVLLILVVFALALTGQFDGGVDEESAEHVEDPGELVDGHRSDGDEDATHCLLYTS